MIKAVIFDMDGLMFDTERLAVEGWVYAGKQMEYNITKELVTKTCGSRVEDTRRIFLEHLGNDMDFYGCRKVRVDYVEKYIADNGLPLKPGLIELLDFLRSNNYKIALASSTEKEKVEHYLKSVDILKYFNSLICGDMVERGKPEPDIYLKAAEALGVLPTECIALEDSLMGILSAYRAKLKPVMIPDLIEPDEETIKTLYAKLTSLSEVIDLLKHGGVIMENSKGEVVVPEELTEVLSNEDEAREFFNSLSNGYKRGYCDWVGGAKQTATRKTRAEKALTMLKNKQKTLKTC